MSSDARKKTKKTKTKKKKKKKRNLTTRRSLTVGITWSLWGSLSWFGGGSDLRTFSSAVSGL